jgi:hypothetical protein
MRHCKMDFLQPALKQMGNNVPESEHPQSNEPFFKQEIPLARPLPYTIWFFIGYWILNRAAFPCRPFFI